MNTLPPSIRALAARYKSQRASIASGATHEGHTLTSLSQRLLLSPKETLDQVSNGNLIALSSANGKHVFSSRSLDAMRGRVVQFITTEIYEEMSARGYDLERIEMAVQRGLARQHELSRRPDNVISFARTPSDDDDNTLRNAALLAGGAAAGYGVAKYLRGRNGNNGNALPGSSPQPGLPGPSGPKPFDPNSSAVNANDGIERHPGPRSISAPITTQSPRTLGGKVIDPLSEAVQSGRRAIAKKGSAIWQSLRNVRI
jgi:hypothetical protein